jgi:hypothetical protein
MDPKTSLTLSRGWVQALFALACCIATGAHAADSLPPGMSLKLDLALVNSADDCDDGDLAVPAPIAAAKPAASTPMTTPEPIHLAKLAPVQPTIAAQAAPMPAPAKPAAVADGTRSNQTWDIVPADKTLNAALARWAAQAGWQLVWDLPVDYAVEARTVVPGTFEEAVGLVARSMDSAEIPMKAIFYSGNKVLRIVAKGAQ